MKVYKVSATKALPAINKWLKARGLAIITATELPKLGFYVPGVAFAFIRKVEGNIGMLESVVANPTASIGLRDKALDALFHHCKGAGFDKLFGTSQNYRTLMRSFKHGFSRSPQHLSVWSK